MSTFHRTGIDAQNIQRLLVTGGLFLVTVFAAIYTIKSGNPVYMGALIILPFALILLNKSQLAFMLAVVLAPASIGVYRGVDASFLLRFMVCVVFLMGIVLGQKAWKGKLLAEKRPLILFFWVIILLMAVRGTGLRILGSATWGGTVYIHLLMAIFFFFAVNGLKVSKKYIKWIIKGTVLFGVIGSAVGFLGWSTDNSSEVMQETAGSTSRLTYLIPVSGSLLALCFLTGRRKPVLAFLFLTGAFAAIAATGFRSKLVGMIMVVGVYYFFKSKNKILYASFGMVCAVLMWVGIVLLSPALPTSMQRAVSFVPGATVDYMTALHAEGSIEWRLDIWRYALAQSKEYLLIGRGLAFDVYDVMEELGIGEAGRSTPWRAFQVHNYHSGPVQALIDMGLPGLVAVLWLHILIYRRMWRLAVRLAPLDTPESRYLSFLCAEQIWGAVAFYLVFGYIVGFAIYLVQAATIMVLANSLFESMNTGVVSAENPDVLKDAEGVGV